MRVFGVFIVDISLHHIVLYTFWAHHLRKVEFRLADQLELVLVFVIEAATSRAEKVDHGELGASQFPEVALLIHQGCLCAFGALQRFIDRLLTAFDFCDRHFFFGDRLRHFAVG